MRHVFFAITLLAAHAANANSYNHLPFQNQQLDLQQQTINQLSEQNMLLKTMQEKQQKQIETLDKILQYQAAQLQVLKQQLDLQSQAAIQQ